MIVEKLGMTAKLQGRAGSGTAMVGLVEKAESMSPPVGAMIVEELGRRQGKVDNWDYDR